MEDEGFEPGTYVPLQKTVRAAQINPDTARSIAKWCGGWATDDLRWSDHMRCFMAPDDHEWPGSLFPTWGPERVVGGVMMRYGVVALPGEWVVQRGDRFSAMSDAAFSKEFEPERGEG